MHQFPAEEAAESIRYLINFLSTMKYMTFSFKIQKIFIQYSSVMLAASYRPTQKQSKNRYCNKIIIFLYIDCNVAMVERLRFFIYFLCLPFFQRITTVFKFNYSNFGVILFSASWLADEESIYIINILYCIYNSIYILESHFYTICCTSLLSHSPLFKYYAASSGS